MERLVHLLGHLWRWHPSFHKDLHQTPWCIKPLHGGKDCAGDNSKTKTCQEHECYDVLIVAVDGLWSKWSEWSICSASCGGGTKKSTRSCTPPVNGGQPCQGDSVKVRACGMKPCPVKGVWNNWGEWTKCTRSCGGGFQSTRRKCSEPLYGGRPCGGRDVKTRLCGPGPCPVNGEWSKWSQWDACSVSCGGGQTTRKRKCEKQSNGGLYCVGPPFELQKNNCRMMPCPIEAHWSSWSSWSPCTHSCGSSGTSLRFRECNSPKNSNTPCPKGAPEETKPCNVEVVCPVNGAWSAWQKWSSCTATCGNFGWRKRKRRCDSPPPNDTGKSCVGRFEEKLKCNRDTKCPIDGVWGAWSPWSNCPKTCGGAEQSRARECDHPSPSAGGKSCHGSSTVKQACALEHCPESDRFILER